MGKFTTLEPHILWRYFEDITRIPRPSKKEEKIIRYLKEFSKENNLNYKTDHAGNVLITKPATRGMENRKTVVLQSHLDMVCEKNSEIPHDFENSGIEAYIEGDWIRAKGTTLGADDGIGIAAQLAVLSSDDISHGHLECLFTVDEETGLTGANELQPDFFTGKILINLDSEDEGELFIGCAGGIDTIAVINYKTRNVPGQHLFFEMNIKGLKGGHSGDDIHKGLGNSIKILARFLWNATHKLSIRLSKFDGGNLRNAIPREASAIFALPFDEYTKLIRFFNKFSAVIKKELNMTEPGLVLNLIQSDISETIINKKAQHRLLNCLYACPNGVIEWSHEMENLVETSTNLASVKFTDDNKIIVTTSQRSSVDSAKNDISDRMEALFQLGNAEVTHSTGYPGWKPDMKSEILNITRQSYRNLFGNDPKVRAIHAGLECGLFLQKYPYLDMISFGPTIKGAHSPDERLEINSVGRFWSLLLDVLQNIPGK